MYWHEILSEFDSPRWERNTDSNEKGFIVRVYVDHGWAERNRIRAVWIVNQERGGSLLIDRHGLEIGKISKWNTSDLLFALKCIGNCTPEQRQLQQQLKDARTVSEISSLF